MVNQVILSCIARKRISRKQRGLVKMYIVITADIRGYPFFLKHSKQAETGTSNSSLGLTLALASVLALNN